jgi:hypothetical protein
MAKRISNRRVVLRLRSRDAEDPRKWLDAIEQAFRPNEMWVIVDDSPDTPDPDYSLADEVLETTVRARVAETLDQRDAIAKSKPSVSGPAPARDITRRLFVIRKWVHTRLKSGWKIAVKFLSVANSIKDLFS